MGWGNISGTSNYVIMDRITRTETKRRSEFNPANSIFHIFVSAHLNSKGAIGHMCLLLRCPKYSLIYRHL